MFLGRRGGLLCHTSSLGGDVWLWTRNNREAAGVRKPNVFVLRQNALGMHMAQGNPDLLHFLAAKNWGFLHAPGLCEGSTHVMTVRCWGLRSTQFLGALVLYINGPSTIRGSPEYTQ